MNLASSLSPYDTGLLKSAIDGFVPDRVIDIHLHALDPAFYKEGSLSPYLAGRSIDPFDSLKAVSMLFPKRQLEGLVFGFPVRGNDRIGLNKWIDQSISKDPQGNSLRFLALAAPEDSPEAVEQLFKDRRCIGIKPYHVYGRDGDTEDLCIEEFAPEWMWRLCNHYNGILMLHVMRHGAMADKANALSISRFCEKYPHCQLILAHAGRSFCYRNAHGLKSVKDFPNVFVDTSGITEPEGLRTALQILGSSRVLYGSDYPISHLSGKCVTIGNSFQWLLNSPPSSTLVGIESLLALREAAESLCLDRNDIERIFSRNARNLLRTH